VNRQFVYGGQYIDEPLFFDRNEDPETDNDCTEQDDKRYMYCQNPNWNVMLLTDDDGAAVERYVYEPYGTFTVTLDNESGNPYRFQGRRYESDTGLYYFRNRDYNAKLGRFLQRDPTGYADGMSFYQVVRSNPANLIDSHGYWSTATRAPVPAVRWEDRRGTEYNPWRTRDDLNKAADRSCRKVTATKLYMEALGSGYEYVRAIPMPSGKQRKLITSYRPIRWIQTGDALSATAGALAPRDVSAPFSLIADRLIISIVRHYGAKCVFRCKADSRHRGKYTSQPVENVGWAFLKSELGLLGEYAVLGKNVRWGEDILRSTWQARDESGGIKYIGPPIMINMNPTNLAS